MKQETKGKSKLQAGTKAVKKVLESVADKIGTMLSSEKPDLQDLFVNQLKDLYWAEKHLVENLPLMAEKATTRELKEAIENHLEETKIHVERLEDVFEMIGEEPETMKCDAMDGLVMEAQKVMASTSDDSLLRDVAIIAASQKVEHYEIASYGTLKTLATVLGQPDVAAILELTLSEEKDADNLLSEIAEGFVNENALDEQ